MIDSVEGLAWIAQQAALEMHVPQWRLAEWTVRGRAKPGPITRLVFDLDPGPGVGLPERAAGPVRPRYGRDIGLDAYPVTSGSKGIHVYVRWRR